MKHLTKLISLAALVLLSQALLSQAVNAQQYSKVTYVHSDPDGTPFAATDSQGNIEWQIDHFPYGKEYENTQVARKSDISFAGKPYDEEIGLSYFGGRWYDPDVGRFTGIDPMPVNPVDYRTYNRYNYGFNNPYKYVDPDGNHPILIAIAIFVAKEAVAEGLSQFTYGASDIFSVRKMGLKGFRAGAQLLGSKNKEKLARTCCFVAGTQVLTEAGYKSIEDVVLGEKVWAKNTDTGEEAWKPVTKLWREPDRGIYEIQATAADGFVQKIEATDDHPFYVHNVGWKKTVELKVGDLLESNLGEPLTVKSVVNENRTDLTYNFTVADFHTYYVTERNVLVHNCPPGDASKGPNDVIQLPHTDKFGNVISRNPKSIQDQMTLDAAKGGQGIVKVPSLGDAKFKGMQKIELETISLGGKKSNVHFVRDPKTGNTMDFKFIKHSTDRINKAEK